MNNLKFNEMNTGLNFLMNSEYQTPIQTLIHFPTFLNSRRECPGWKNITLGASSHTSKRFKQISHLPVL